MEYGERLGSENRPKPRPVYYKSSERAVIHLHLGIPNYLLVNTIRCRLKASDVNSHWHEIVRIGNTQMMVTTTGTNRAGCTIRNQEMLQSTHNCENRNPSWE